MPSQTPISDSELNAFLKAHPSWNVEQGQLARTFEAPTFLKGLGFVDKVGRAAEEKDHHPDIDIRWKKVTLRFVTHDAGNRITALDTSLAGTCDQLFDAV